MKSIVNFLTVIKSRLKKILNSIYVNIKISYSIFLIFILLFSCKKTVNTEKEIVNIILPDQSQCVILLSDSIIPERASVFLDASGIAYLLIDSVVFHLEAENIDSIKEPMLFFDSIIPDKICCFNDGTILFSENNFLSQVEGGEIKRLMAFPSNNFNIEKAGEKGAYISFFDDSEKQYNLILVNKDEMTAHKLLNDSLPIIVSGFGELTAIALEKSVYLLYEGENKLIFQAQEPIRHLAFAPNGIFYTTENNVGYFNSEINIIFLEKAIRDMLSVDNMLFLLSKDGSLYKITNTEYFKELSNYIK